MRLLLIFILIIANMPISQASLYSCTSPESKPSLLGNQDKVQLTFTNSAPIFSPREQNRTNLEHKKPFLIYYAVDSSEAFMKYSVRYEVARLLKSCKANPNVNFIALINSHFVKKNQFLICKDQKPRYVKLSEFAQLNRLLELKKKFIITGDHTSGERGPLKYMTKYFKEANKPFGKYLLAHPDFVYDLIHLVSNNENLFPSHTYAPFINFKSHGSKFEVLAGMYECQDKAKRLSANKVIANILTKSEIRFLNSLKTPEKVEENLESYESIISKIDLGNERGVGAFKPEDESESSNNLGHDRLGHDRLGGAVSGLGVNQGLGTETAFGTINVALTWILDDLYPSGSKNSLGFLMLESCESNRYPYLFHEYLENVFGYYSAKESLWYRNLNWWDILERANGSTEQMIKILREETPKIPNIKVVENKTSFISK